MLVCDFKLARAFFDPLLQSLVQSAKRLFGCRAVVHILGRSVPFDDRALLIAATFDFVGAFFLGSKVAETVGKGIVDPHLMSRGVSSTLVIIAALLLAFSPKVRKFVAIAVPVAFVLSFGYWCTDFLVVQRAMAAGWRCY